MKILLIAGRGNRNLNQQYNKTNHKNMFLSFSLLIELRSDYVLDEELIVDLESLEEIKLRRSEFMKGENHPLFGKHLPNEVKQKISKSHDNPIISPEGIEYSSIKAAAKEIGVSRATLSRRIKNHPELGWRKSN